MGPMMSCGIWKPGEWQAVPPAVNVLRIQLKDLHREGLPGDGQCS